MQFKKKKFLEDTNWANGFPYRFTEALINEILNMFRSTKIRIKN